MKKAERITKILTIVMVAIMLVTISSNVFAAVEAVDPSTWTGNSATGVKTDELKNWINTIINIVSTVGSGAAIIVLIILGIKYMMGSAEEKAEYKKTLMPYIIGAAFVFGASALVGIIYNFIGGAQ